MFPFESETYRANIHDIDNMDEMFVTMVDFNKMLNDRSNAMNSTATYYQPASNQPTIPVNGYHMPAQAQAMPPAQSDLPWDQGYQQMPGSVPQMPGSVPQMPGSVPQMPGSVPQAQPVRREVPAGRYVCELADVREGTTKSGMPRISFAWRIVDGEFKNLWIWDNVTLGSQQGYEILGIKLAHIQPGWTHVDTADMYDEARAVRGWATARRYSVSKVAQPNGFFRIYADLIG